MGGLGAVPKSSGIFANNSQWWRAPGAAATNVTSPARIGVSSSRVLNADPAYNAIKNAGLPLNNAAMDRYYQTTANTRTTPYQPTSVPPALRNLPRIAEIDVGPEPATCVSR